MKFAQTMIGARRQGFTPVRYRTENEAVTGWITEETPKRVRFFFAGERVQRWLPRDETRHMVELR